MNNPITAVLIGAGDRGNVYGQYAFDNPTILNIIAVAEPNKIRRRIFAKKHNILREKSFLDWNELLQQDKLADTAIISTPDRLHFEPARCAMEKGYDVLLEKPMAVKVEKCIALVKLSEKLGKILQICHVLRYTKFFSVIRKTIEDGEIGRIVNISMRENVSYFHYAHSYIRGNWHNRDMSCPMILAKCSHDLDILYWLIDSEPNKISSFGSLTNFGKNNAPKGAATRCTDNCKFKENCLYYAPRIYLDIVPILHIAMKGG